MQILDLDPELGMPVQAPWPGGLDHSDADITTIVYDEGGLTAVGVELDRHGMKFTWLLMS